MTEQFLDLCYNRRRGDSKGPIVPTPIMGPNGIIAPDNAVAQVVR